MSEPVLEVNKILVQAVDPETGEIICYRLVCKLIQHENGIILVGLNEKGETQGLFFSVPPEVH